MTEGQLPRTAAPEQMALDDDEENTQLMRMVVMVWVMMMVRMLVFEMVMMKINWMRETKLWRDVLWYHRWNYCPIQPQFKSRTDD